MFFFSLLFVLISYGLYSALFLLSIFSVFYEFVFLPVANKFFCLVILIFTLEHTKSYFICGECYTSCVSVTQPFTTMTICCGDAGEILFLCVHYILIKFKQYFPSQIRYIALVLYIKQWKIFLVKLAAQSVSIYKKIFQKTNVTKFIQIYGEFSNKCKLFYKYLADMWIFCEYFANMLTMR